MLEPSYFYNYAVHKSVSNAPWVTNKTNNFSGDIAMDTACRKIRKKYHTTEDSPLLIQGFQYYLLFNKTICKLKC